MFSLSRALAAGVALAVSARAGTDHFILHQVRTLEYTRVDPLVNPGANGNHVHHIMGGSAFGPNTGSPESLQNSQCSSSLVGDDKSAYWAPLVYYNQGNGSYTPMVGETRIYYFLKSSDKNTPIKAFPRGHRMLAGPETNRRPDTYPPRGELSYEQQQAMDPRVAAIKWGCSSGAVQGEGNGGSLPGQRPYLPNDAPNGCGVLNAGIFFPSCGDGRLDSDDHFSHMAYPVDEANGSKCPSSHPIKYPTMFMESFYFPSSSQPYRGPNKDNWVLSNGDTLGLTFHADFINGWAPGVLEDVLSQCGAPNAPGQDLEKCAPLAKSLSIDNANKCRSQGDIVIEDIGLTSPITSLPGCNPIWPVEARSKPNCKSGDMPMGPPDARVEFPEFSIALPVAKKAGQAKVEAPPAQTSSSASSSSLSSAAASTSTAAPTSTTSPTSTDASTPVSTTSSVYSDPFAAGAPATSGTSTSDAASASQTSTGYVDPYANGAPAGSGSGSSSSSASAAQPTGYADPYAMGAPSGGSSATSAPSASGAPGATPSTSVSASQPTVSNPAGVNPPANSAPASGSSSSPQKANVVGAPKPKTCVRRKNKKPHGTGQRRRDWRKRLIN